MIGRSCLEVKAPIGAPVPRLQRAQSVGDTVLLDGVSIHGQQRRPMPITMGTDDNCITQPGRYYKVRTRYRRPRPAHIGKPLASRNVNVSGPF